jgi:hypothetical protein
LVTLRVGAEPIKPKPKRGRKAVTPEPAITDNRQSGDRIPELASGLYSIRSSFFLILKILMDPHAGMVLTRSPRPLRREWLLPNRFDHALGDVLGGAVRAIIDRSMSNAIAASGVLAAASSRNAGTR